MNRQSFRVADEMDCATQLNADEQSGHSNPCCEARR